MISSGLIRMWMLFAFSRVTVAKREEIELQDGQIYNLTVTNNFAEEGRPSSTWLVRAPDNCRILVRFVEFMLQNIDDTLVVGTGSSVRDASSILARFSGMFPSQSILVPSRRAWLKLNSTTDSVLPQRLEILMEAVHHEREVLILENQTIEISSPGYPHQYPNYADVIWKISASAGQSVTFRFKDIDLENRYDKLIIGAGSDFSDRGTHLTSISNQYNKTDLPTDLIVPGDQDIWLRFQADISKAFRGFLIEVIAGPDPFEEFDTEPSEQHIEITSPVNIASKNYPSRYPRSQNTTWYLIPPINQQIRVDVISCHLEPKHDSVAIGTRLANSSDVLVLTGSSTPRGFYAEFPVNASVLIRFKTDYSIAYQGFWIRVSAMVERETKVTPILKMESPGSHPDLGGSSTTKDKTNSFMIPMFSAIGVVVLLMVVTTLTISCYCVRRRRTKPMETGHHVLSHLYSTPDTGAFHTPAHPHPRTPDSPSRSMNIPMVQVSCGNRAPINDQQTSESAYHEFEDDYECADDYDAVDHTRIHHHVYSIAEEDQPHQDTTAYCQIEHDYATAINDTDNDYANFQETDMSLSTVDLKVLATRPLYMTTIENNQKPQTTNAYHRYLPMDACTTRRPTAAEKEPRMPPGATIQENVLDVKTHAYANMTSNPLTSETTGEKLHDVQTGSNDVTSNDTYEAMSPESNDDRVNDTVYELENESGDRLVTDTYIVGHHQREHARHHVVKPKVAPKRKKHKDNVVQKNSYANAVYDKYSIS